MTTLGIASIVLMLGIGIFTFKILLPLIYAVFIFCFRVVLILFPFGFSRDGNTCRPCSQCKE